ncbi:MAG: aldehyde ferredoxin oxidoreductase N-terminal domain-containing protein [Desulfovibrionales bacterium]
MYGVTGNVLILDLEQKSSRVESISEDISSQWLGGAGLCVHLLSRFGDEDRLAILAPGLLTGTGTLASCSSFLVGRGTPGKEPAFAVIKDHFGAELKYAGFDAIVLYGQSVEPLYLQIGPDGPKFLSARHLWNMTTEDAERSIREQAPDPWTGREMQILSIGPAGEHLAALAGLVVNGWNVAGSRGLGQVFGESKLKAVSITGSKSLKLAKPGPFLRSVSNQIATLKNSKKRLQLNEKGPIAYYQALAEGGMLQQEDRGVPEDFLSRVMGKKACFSCPVGCLKWMRTSHGEGFLPEGDSFLAALGDFPGEPSAPEVLTAYWECTRNGLDFPSFLATLRLAGELYGAGRLDLDDLGWPLPKNWQETASIVDRIGRERKQGCLLSQECRELMDWADPDAPLQINEFMYPGLSWEKLPRTRQYLGTGGSRSDTVNMLAMTDDLDWKTGLDQDPGTLGWGMHLLGVCHFAAPVLDLEALYESAGLALGIDLSPELVRKAAERTEKELHQSAGEPAEA